MVLGMYRLMFVSSCFVFRKKYRIFPCFTEKLKTAKAAPRPPPKRTYDVSRVLNRYVRLPVEEN